MLFLAAGWAYGAASGDIKSHRDVVKMMSGAMGDLAYYLVLAFFAAHFVAMFNWSNLGVIMAVQGADAIRASGMPAPVLLVLMVLLAASINIFIGSASAKWALLAPVMVPMLMLLGVSPEASTAAYRVGDSTTNIITPLMPYFPLVVAFCQRYVKNTGIGTLTSLMLPFSITFLICWTVFLLIWWMTGFDLGVQGGFTYTLPR